MSGNGGIAMDLAGLACVLYPDATAYLPDAHLLLASDLHLGRGESAQAVGRAVPATGAGELDRVLARSQALGGPRVIILGDIIHAPVGLTDGLAESIAAWVSHLPAPPVLVPGNHDRRVVPRLGELGMLGPEVLGDLLSPLPPEIRPLLSHKPEEEHGAHPTICGHLHPCLKISRSGERLRLRAFVQRGNQLILPASSRHTGCSGYPLSRADRAWAVLGSELVETQGRA